MGPPSSGVVGPQGPMSLPAFRQYVLETLIPQTFHLWSVERIRFVAELDHPFVPDFHVTKTRPDRFGSWTHFVQCAYQDRLRLSEVEQMVDYVRQFPIVRSGTIFVSSQTTCDEGVRELLDEEGLRVVVTSVLLHPPSTRL